MFIERHRKGRRGHNDCAICTRIFLSIAFGLICNEKGDVTHSFSGIIVTQLES